MLCCCCKRPNGTRVVLAVVPLLACSLAWGSGKPNVTRPMSHSNAEKQNRIWQEVIELNRFSNQTQVSTRPDTHRLFEKAVRIIQERKLLDALEELRDTAFQNDDFSELDRRLKQCQPVLQAESMGESIALGIGFKWFSDQAKPGGVEYRFYQLAKDGCYLDGSRLLLGNAECPVWIERGESSFQGRVNKQAAITVLKKWLTIESKLQGEVLRVARETITGLRKVIDER